MSEITAEKVREWLADTSCRYLERNTPDIARAFIAKYEEVDSWKLTASEINDVATAEIANLQSEIDYLYKPSFFAITDYVQGKDWGAKYLGRSCHDVIVDRCETLQKENQRLQSIIDKSLEDSVRLRVNNSYLEKMCGELENRNIALKEALALTQQPKEGDDNGTN